MEPYPWIVLLHVVGAFVFILSHGVSAWMTLAIRAERDRSRIGALLDLSQMSIGGAYVGLLLLLIGGIWAGIYGNHFSRGWIWAAVVVLVLVIVAMYAIATPYFGRLREAVGRPARGNAPPPVPASDQDVAALAGRAPAMPLLATGVAGLLVLLWLMVIKPF
jgi:hypothetical protein